MIKGTHTLFSLYQSTKMLKISKYILYLTSSNVQNRYQTIIKRYLSKLKRLKRFQEDESVFGTLVETSAQKKKRLKLETKEKISGQEPNTINTELSWIMHNSGNNLKKIISPENEQINPPNPNKNKKSSLKEFNKEENRNSADQNTKNIFHSETNQAIQEIGLKITNPKCNSTLTKNINNNHNEIAPTIETSQLNQTTSIESSNNASISNSNISNIGNTTAKPNMFSNSGRLPDIIIKNLPSFPIMCNKQKYPTKLTEILSISEKRIKYPSVTKILTQTMSLESKLALEAWKERMIKILGQEGFEMHQKALLEDGISLHSFIAQHLLGKEYEIPSRIEGAFKSVQYVLEDVCHVKAIETHVAHTKLHYRGMIDCVASYRGENYVIDWKRSDKQKLELKYTYDGPLQIAAYIGAINASNLHPFVINRGLLVIAYTCGAPATVHELCDDTLQRYWTMWLHRLQKYYVEKTSDGDNRSICQ